MGGHARAGQDGLEGKEGCRGHSRGGCVAHQSPRVSCLPLGVESPDRAGGLRTLGGKGTGFECGPGSSCCWWQEGSWKGRQRLFSSLGPSLGFYLLTPVSFS